MKTKSKKFYLFLVIVLCLLFFAFFNLKKIEDAVGNKVWVEDSDSVSVLNFGDVMFDRGVRNIMENRGRDPFEYIKKNLDALKKFDVIIANLEGPIVEMNRELCQSKAYNFQFRDNTPEILKSVGINMVNIANNHTFDCYRAGFDSTKKFLNVSGIDIVGDSELEKSYVVKIINNKKVVFIGIDETVQVVPVSSFYGLIEKLKNENDYVVVNIHWGKEYELVESESQRNIAHKLIDSGADVIFGHHPHVIQPVRIYKGKAIFYSLGNFVFDQNFGDTTTGLGAGVEFREDKTIFTLLPFRIKVFAPDFLVGVDKEKFCESFLKNLSHNKCSFEIPLPEVGSEKEKTY